MDGNKRNSTSLRLAASYKPVPRDISESLGKLPPQALDLEEAVLGAVLIESKSIERIEFLKAEHFYVEQHQEIFSAILEVQKSDTKISTLSVFHQLRRTGKSELIGGATYLSDLTTKIVSAANIEHDARIIMEMWTKRELIQLASHVHAKAYDDTTDVFELHDWLSNHLFELTNFKEVKKEESIQDIHKREVGKLKDRMRMGGLSGMTTGFTRLNQATGGWQKTDLIIVAGRPGMGKSGFIGSSVKVSSKTEPTAVFSLEMSAESWVQRYLASDNDIDVHRIRTGKITEEEFAFIIKDQGAIHELKLYIDDTPAITLNQLLIKVRRLVQKYGIKKIVIDYLQLMRGEGIKGQSREQEIATISRGLKELAKEFDIVVIALCQLSRGVESRSDKRPQLSDLRESGAIEQDADIVIFLFRPEYYKIKTLDLGNGQEIDSEGICEAIIAKNRNGGLATVPLTFIGRFTKFTDYEPKPKTEEPITGFKKKEKKEEKKVEVKQEDEGLPF